jgi:hypothetical protein
MAGQGRLVMGLIFRPKRQNRNRNFFAAGIWPMGEYEQTGIIFAAKSRKSRKIPSPHQMGRRWPEA